jgi:broad specificity phosphatase PhoE
LSSIYLIRHGQAGSRDDYDRLSETGWVQARRLGEYLRSQGLRFHAAFCGSLRRQCETAQAVLGQLDAPPDLRVDTNWNEFSLEGLWQYMAPRMMADAGFARLYERDHASNPLVDRVITECDITLIRAWMRGLHPMDQIESWQAFHQRVLASRQSLLEHANGNRIAIFTSATPIGIWCGNALELAEPKVFRIAAVLHNTSITSFRLRPEDLTLFTLNQTPHLDDTLRTFR